MLTPKQKTYGLIFLIALLVSVLLYNFVLLEQLPKFSVADVVNIPFKSPEVKQTFLFHDLDKDGIDEKVKLKTRYEDKSIFSIVVYNLPENPIEQYNFKCSDMTIDWIAFADVVGDSTEEIIPFYNRNDTIFCSIAELSKSELVERDIFVLAKPDEIYSDIWNPHLSVIGINRDKFGETEVLIAIQADYAQVPRGIFKFSLSKKRVSKTLFFGANINYHNTLLFDLNNDGVEEIVVSTQSTMNNGNLPKLPFFNDLQSWLIVLDNNFDTLFTKSLDIPYSSIQNSILIEKKENFIIALFQFSEDSHILKIDSEGKIVKEQSLKERPFAFVQNLFYSNSKNIVIQNGKEIIALDSNFDIVKKITNKSRIQQFYSVNIDSDAETEYLVWKKDEIDFLDNDLSNIITLNIKLKNNSVFNPIVHTTTKNGIYFHLNAFDRQFDFNIVPNQLYYFRYIFFVEILILVYLIGLLANNILNRSYVFFHLLENSTQKSNLGIIIMSQNKKFSFVNKSAKNIFGSNNLRIINKDDLTKAVIKEKSFKNFIDEVFLKLIELKKEINLSNGKIIEITIIPIGTPLGLPLALYIQITDLTESLLSDRAKTLAHSIQKVAHEIKTPLSSVLLSLDSLEQNLSNQIENRSAKDDFNVARKEIDRIKKFINGFLKFANMAGTQLSSCNLKELIENSLLRFSTYLSNGIEVEINVDNEILVMVDSYQIEEVFQVFIENSIDAMQGKGRIEIKAIEEDKNSITISIKDNGSGIEEEKLPSIFQPYMTTKKDGTGMGLAIAKKILEDHKSEIEVTSILGKGTEFRFFLKSNEK